MDELRTLARLNIGQKLRELHLGESFVTYTSPAFSDFPDTPMLTILEVQILSYSED